MEKIALRYNGLFGSAGYNVFLSVGKYANGRIAISAVDEDGAPAFVATVNLPDINIPDGCAAIKDWGENAGMGMLLAENGIAEKVVGVVAQGYVHIPIVRLNMSRLEALAGC